MRQDNDLLHYNVRFSGIGVHDRADNAEHERIEYTTAMQALSISRRLVDKYPPEAFTPELIAGEANRVRELYASGLLRQVWKRGDTPGASILWEAASLGEVQAAIETLPLYRAGLLEVTALVPLEPYPAFGPAK